MTRRHSEQGFSLLEVAVAAAILATVLFGMSGVLTSYTATRAKTNDLAIAQNLIQSQVDDVLMHNQVENSLISDTQGRSRPIYLLSNGGPNSHLLVSRYYYFNFPWFPSGTDHNTYGNIWDDSLIQNSNSWSTTAGNPNRFNTGNFPGVLYDAGGNVTGDKDAAAYIARLQLFGTTGSIANVETYISGATKSGEPHGQYLDEPYANYQASLNYLIADTCVNNVNAGKWVQNNVDTTNPSSDTYNSFRDKIFVVRIYTVRTYVTPPFCFMYNPPQGAKPEVAHGYVVINGQVRL